ncbi:MAG: hypothetical protein Q9169_005472 [Polycauliona sp. 2 TL-2023]
MVQTRRSTLGGASAQPQSIAPNNDPSSTTRGLRTRAISISSMSSLSSLSSLSGDSESDNEEAAPRLRSTAPSPSTAPRYQGSLPNNDGAPAETRQLRLYTPSESNDSADAAYEDEEEEQGSDEEMDSDDNSDEEVVSDREARRRGKARAFSPKAKTAPKRDANAPALSKLQKKILDARERNIELDENGVRKGDVRGSAADGTLKYLNRGAWVPAVYHEQIREVLLEGTDSLGSYVEEPQRGHDPLDRTSFKAEQKDWVFEERASRHEVLFYWSNPGNGPKYEPRLCGRSFRTAYPVNVRDTEWNDLRARMPKETQKDQGKVSKTIKTPMLANRMSNSRILYGLKAWDPKQGSDIKEHRMLMLMPPDAQRKLIETNSTKHLRDLTTAEIDFVEIGNKGTAESLAKAGPRQLDEASRKKYLEKKRRSGRFDPASVTTYSIIPEALEDRNEPKQKKARRSVPGRSTAPSSAAGVSGDTTMSGMGDDDHDHVHGDLAREILGEQPTIESDEEDAVLAGPSTNRRSSNFARLHALEGEYLDKVPDHPLPPRPTAAEAPLRPNRRRTYSDVARETHMQLIQQQLEANDEEHRARVRLLRARQRTSDLRRVSANLDRSRGVDYREKYPRTDAHRELIQESLFITRENFREVLGFESRVQTTVWQPYVYQLSDIQDEFEQKGGEGRLRSRGWSK